MSKFNTPDVSKSLFMDLAFILISILVLLIKEPFEDQFSERAKLMYADIRSTSIEEIIVDESINGKSIKLKIASGPIIKEVKYNLEEVIIDIEKLEDRIKMMGQSENKVIILMPEDGISYKDFAIVRDLLSGLTINNEITKIYEMVKIEDK